MIFFDIGSMVLTAAISAQQIPANPQHPPAIHKPEMEQYQVCPEKVVQEVMDAEDLKEALDRLCHWRGKL